MSGRTYLSIGDVLALLRQEFPDVTISKIRFLESQGLVNPERTPSGYRKFYEHDVERLRWVLRQQREHFLPLKVIKGRLEQEGAEPGDDNGRAGAAVPGYAEPVLAGRAPGPAGPRAAGRELPGFEARPAEHARGVDTGGGRAAPSSGASDLGRSRGVAPSAAATVGAASRSDGSTGPSRSTGDGQGTGTVARASPPAPAPTRPGRDRVASGTMPGDVRTTPRSTAARPGAPEPVKVSGGAAMGSTDLGSRHTRVAHAGGGAGARTGPAVDERDDELVVGALAGATMTIEELAEGSGLEVAAVEQLESYGLLCGRVVGGSSYYDEDDLTVARVAAGLARYGVEARHLRLHKHAAEREAGFIEQIVLPLLKQRNPEARQRANKIVTELTQLGQALREVLLRTTLRDQLGR